jgi:hypothetical protein
MNHLKELSFFLPELVIYVAWLYTLYQLLFITKGGLSWKRVALYVYGAACICSLWLMGYR